MQIHNIQRKTKNKKKMLVGRGGTRGKTSGRGTKGQKARSGRKIRPEIRDVIKRIPKMRGRGKNSNLTIETKPSVVNLERINKAFENGDKVNPSTLEAKKLIKIWGGVRPLVKVLGKGEITKKLIFSECEISAGARVKIEKVGGTVSK